MSVIKSLDEKEEKSLMIKFALFVLFLLISFFVYKIAKAKLHKAQTRNMGERLGAEVKKLKDDNVEVKKRFNQTVSSFGNKFTENAKTTIQGIVNNTKEQISSKAAEIVSDTVADKIIDAINKLPKDESKKVKEKICK